MRARHSILIIFPVMLLAAFTFQDEFINTLQQKLKTYYQQNIPVRLHLFFNQPEYAAGDTAYYKVSFLSAQDNRPIGGHQVIHVNLTDRKGKLIHHQNIAVNNGFGSNQLAVPLSLAPGVYTVVAYSDWMKNHDASLFYYHDLIVAGEKKWERETTDAISLYPEAGNLVAGVSNRMVASGKPGAGFRVVDSRGNAAADGTIDASGWAVVYFTPATGEQYTVRDDQNRSTSLPSIKADGVAMQVVVPEAKENPLRITLQVPEGSAFRDEEVYVIVSQQGILQAAAKVAFNGKTTAVVAIPRQDFPAGILQVTVFTGNGVAQAERLIYSDAAIAAVTADLEKKEFNVREKVVMKIKVRDASGNPVKATLAASVLSKDLFAENAGGQRAQLLQGDLPFGGIASGAIRTNPAARDNFLVTQQWKGFSWEDVWKGTKKRTHSFRNNIFFTGKVRMRDASTSLPDSTKITFFLQRDVTVYEVYLDSMGRFNFPLLMDFWNNDVVYCRVESRNNAVENVEVVMDPPEELPFDLPVFKATGSTDPYGTFAGKKRSVDRAYEFYNRKPSYLKPVVSPHALMEEEIFGPDISINLNDYLLFPTMEETLREIIPFVMHRWHKGKSTVRVWIDDIDMMPSADPVYVIDGVMTDDTEYFMSLKPENVSTIKVVCTTDKLRVFGAVGRNGVVLVETKLLDNAKNVPPADLAFQTTGLTMAVPFRNNRERLSPRVPEIRSTLYWNPDITTDDQGEAILSFYTADNTGTFSLHLDGMTHKGEPVFGEETFEVRFSRSGNH